MTARPVETKVKVSTGVASAVGVGIAVLNAAQEDPSLLGGLPTWAQSLILAIGPGLAVFGAGYRAPHTPDPQAGTGGRE